MQGRFFWNQGAGRDTIQQALISYDEALNLDPEYAKAHAGRAQMLYYLAIYGVRPFEESAAEAHAAAKRALEIAPNLAEAYMVLGQIAFRVAWDWLEADGAFGQAIDLNPGNEQVQGEYSVFLSAMGRGNEAVATARAALDLDPLNLTARERLARTLYYARMYDESRAEYRRILELEPERPSANHVLALLKLLEGDPEGAIAQASNEPIEWQRRFILMLAYPRLGKAEEAMAEKQWLVDNYGDVAAYQYIEIHAQWGEIDEACRWLKFAHEQRDPGLAEIKVDPFLDPLRPDQCFVAVLQDLNLAD